MNKQTYSRLTIAMTGHVSIGDFLINPRIGAVVFLTLTLFWLPHTHSSRADAQPPEEIIDQIKNDNKSHVGQIESYVRKQIMPGLSILPGSIRNNLNWFSSSSWRPVSVAGDDEENAPNPALAGSSDDGFNVPVQLGSHFHHKGFLPTHDAMMMGAGFKEDLVDKKLELSARPYWGQSWDSLRKYWGGEMALDVAERPDGLPWGKISLGYATGDNRLTDHGTGTDLHGDLDLTNGWTFTSGLRQDDSVGDSNYMMLKWKLVFN